MEVAYNIPNKGTRAFVESVISFFVQDLKLQKKQIPFRSLYQTWYGR